MCGIAGIYLKNGIPDREAIQKAITVLRHRGPDESGMHIDSSVGLGHARLSIIDLSTGKQPIGNEDGSIWITYNGEIYNFPELRKDLIQKGHVFKTRTDTETIVHLYEEYRQNCLQHLRGMYAFAIWDKNKQILFLARDRIGVKPLIYSINNSGFFFASEIPAIFTLHKDISRKCDLKAIDYFLTFQYIPAPLTGFKNIRKLPPAHFMIVKDGQIERIERYWDIDFTKRSTLSFDEACGLLKEYLLEATKIRLISDVPLGAFLSGGIDSSLTVAAMSRVSAEPVKTYSIGFEDRSYDETNYARVVAKHYGTDHHEMVVRPDAIDILPGLIDHFGEPMADSSAIPTYYVSKFAREGVTVVLSGDGGDENFAGYKRFYQAALTNTLESLNLLPLYKIMRKTTVAVEGLFNPKRGGRRFPANKGDEVLLLDGIDRYRHLVAYFTEKDKQRFYTPFMRDAVGISETSEFLGVRYNKAKEVDELNRFLYIDLTTYLPEDILFKVDICSMLNSLECRSPFLDYKLIEFAASLPWKFKIKPPKKGKYILKEAFKDWFPEGFLERSKMGFSAPMPRWLREDLYDYTYRELTENLKIGSILKKNEIKSMLEEHRKGLKSHSKRLWCLLVLNKWMERFKVSI